MSQHENEKEDFPSLSAIRIEHVKKTKELILDADSGDIDEVRLFIGSLGNKSRFQLEPIKAVSSLNLYVLTLENLEGKYKSSCDKLLFIFILQK